MNVPGAIRAIPTASVLDRATITVFATSAAAVLLALAVSIAVASEPLLALAAILGVMLLAVVLVVPDTAALIAIALIYSNALVIGSRLHGVPYLAASVLPMLIAVPIAYRLLIARERVAIPAPLPFLIVYLLVQILGTLLARDLGPATAELARFLSEGVLIYLLVTQALRSSVILHRAVWTLLIVGATLGGLSFLQQVTGSFDNDYLGFAQLSEGEAGSAAAGGRNEIFRSGGPIGEQNFYAQMLVVLVPLGISRALGERQLLTRLGAVAVTVLIGLGVVSTYSRGAAVALLMLLAAMAVLRYVKPVHIVLVGIALGIVLSSAPAYVERLSTIEELPSVVGGGETTDPVLLQRTNDVLAAALVFIEHPIIGVGPGMFRWYYREYAPRVPGLEGSGDYAAHNFYAEVAAETGLLGLLAMASIFGLTIRELVRARRRWVGVDRDRETLATGFLLSMLVYLFTGLFLHVAYQRYFWLVMAIAAAAGWILTREAGPSPPALAGRPRREDGGASDHGAAAGRASRPATG